MAHPSCQQPRPTRTAWHRQSRSRSVGPRTNGSQNPRPGPSRRIGPVRAGEAGRASPMRHLPPAASAPEDHRSRPSQSSRSRSPGAASASAGRRRRCGRRRPRRRRERDSRDAVAMAAWLPGLADWVLPPQPTNPKHKDQRQIPAPDAQVRSRCDRRIPRRDRLGWGLSPMERGTARMLRPSCGARNRGKRQRGGL